MTTITGTIECIEDTSNPGYKTKIVTLVPEHRQRAFVEFREDLLKEVSYLKTGDDIKVVVKLEGKISKNSGIRFNNLVATEVSLVEYN